MVDGSREGVRRERRGRRRAAAVAAAGTVLLALAAGPPVPAHGAAATFAPASQPGPALTVSPERARRALRCSAGLRKAARTPVLLSPGTGVTGAGQYRHTWQPALDRLGIPWCTLTPPHMTLGDIQVTGEYLVAAIRSMHERAGRRIAILGHSQGGMSMRWALRFWPDTRAMVSDVIGLAGNNHGSAWQGRTNATACAVGCPPVNLQQVVGSRFLRALNSRAETFRGIAYTEITTDHDEILDNAPPACTSCLRTGAGEVANVSVQRICPADPVDHAGLATDLVAYRLVLDALRHRGPADAARIPRSVCAQLDAPGANPLTSEPAGTKDTRGLQLVVCGAPCNTIGAPMVTREPSLARYVSPRSRPARVSVARDAAVERAAALVARMTLDEELSLVGSGVDGVPRLGVPPLRFVNGPNGVGNGERGVTAFPAAIGLGAAWDTELARSYGAALGAEAAGKGKTVIGAPTINLLRSPRWGRAAETFSEDPFLTSALVVPEVQGIQSRRVIAQVKHYAANNQEVGRFGGTFGQPGVDVQVDERTLYDVYYRAFRAAVGPGGAASVMCSYNRINGVQACEDAAHLAALRTFGLRGFVEPDATLAVRDVLAAARAGVQNFQLGTVASIGPAGNRGSAEARALAGALAAGTLPRSVVDTAARDILVAMDRVGLLDGTVAAPKATVSTAAHRRLATRIATQGTVLLKNTRDVLPLTRSGRSVAVIGDDAERGFQSALNGSAAVRPGAKVITPLAGIRRRAPRGTRVVYARGTPGTVSLPVVPASALRLTGTYYGSTDWSGEPVARTTVSTVDFASEARTPLVPIPGTTARSARWTGTLTPPESGRYQFSLSAAGLSRLTIDGRRVVATDTEFMAGAPRWPGAPDLVSRGSIVLRKGRAVPITVEYSNGLSIAGAELHLGWTPPSDEIARAVRAARRADVAVVFANDDTGEGMDRDTLALPADQDRLIAAVAAANPRTVVVLNTSGPVLMPWHRDVAAIVEQWYPGQTGGAAIAQTLFGDADPSGRLPVTWPASASQGPTASASAYPGTGNAVRYSEGRLIGYRWYDAKRQRPLYPFGHGLSYTRFRLGRTTARRSGADGIAVAVPVTNTGRRSGTEVVQVYVTPPAATGAPRQLAGFARVTLRPGARTTARVAIPAAALQAWDGAARRYAVAPGTYRVAVGASAGALGTPVVVRGIGA
jgi:beta-glucosidase